MPTVGRDDATAAIAERLAIVGAEIDAAVRARGDGPSVRLVAVSKRWPAGAVQAAIAAGQLEFGENYAQELREKRETLASTKAHWHFIGALQSNKVPSVLGSTLIHTIDRPSVLTALDNRAQRDGIDQSVLVQVNVAAEAGKAGVAVRDLAALLDRFADLARVRCHGLMVIPPAGAPEATRPHFAALRRLAEHHGKTARAGVALDELSMGMSADYPVAIQEGATIVRVGTAIFGARPQAPTG